MLKTTFPTGRNLLLEHLVILILFSIYFSAGLACQLLLGKPILANFVFYFQFLLQFAPPFLFFFIFIGFLFHLINNINQGFSCIPDYFKNLRSNYFSKSGAGQFIIILALIPPFLSINNSLKQDIPVINNFNWDQTFFQIDRYLHFGRSPWEWLQPVIGHPIVTRFFDYAYSAWGLFLIYTILWMALSRRKILRLQFFSTLILIWALLGTLLATLFSSAGPCYFGKVTAGKNVYAPLMAYLHSIPDLLAVKGQQSLWEAHLQASILPLKGISAMPSMHVAVAVLLALVFLRISPWLGVPMVFYAVVIQIGSIHLGWHYAIDGYVSTVLTVLIWKATGRFLANTRGKHSLQRLAVSNHLGQVGRNLQPESRP